MCILPITIRLKLTGLSFISKKSKVKHQHFHVATIMNVREAVSLRTGSSWLADEFGSCVMGYLITQ